MQTGKWLLDVETAAMTTTIPPATENPSSPWPLFPKFWLWMALNLLTVTYYLLSLPLHGEGIILLLGLAGFWTGIIAVFWRYPWLRLIPVVMALLSFYPIRTGTTRLLLLFGLAALWIAAAVVFRQRRGVLITLMAGAGLVAGFALLPGRTLDATSLRAEYVRSLEDFQGTAYVWGGENSLGIDCSGLIRCGWIDANLRTGLRTLNPGPVRQAARIWWQDCSAEELGQGYRGRTHLLLTTPSLNRLDYRQIQSGDVAVTQSGAHTLAYLGNHTWIEADPLAGAVIMLRAPVAKNPWFEEPMKIMRWRAEE